MGLRSKTFPARSTQPQRLTTGQWQLDIVASHTSAGFEEISRDTVFRRFYAYLHFLQSHNMLVRPIVESLSDVRPTTELWTTDLTDDGFRFVQFSLTRWFNRLYKDAGAQKEAQYLERWHAKYLALPSGSFAST